MLKNPGLYVHFPWCLKKCPYCDFNSHPVKEEIPQKRYSQSLQYDLTEQIQNHQNEKFSTIFFGGGTPSLMSPKSVGKILDIASPTSQAEVTLELNPGTLEFNSLTDFASAGVNRISIGAQSFNNTHLKTLGRIHGQLEIIFAFEAARKAGFENINIDIMWGLPNQNVEESLDDLKQAIKLEPEHISWYQLTIEPKTEFYVRKPLLPPEDVLSGMELSGLLLLEENQYKRYEISAFAKNTYECRHNINYWTFGDYLGIGAGAHGKITELNQIIRIQKPNQPRIYQEDSSTSKIQSLNTRDLILEFLMNSLRLVNGVEWSVFQRNTGLNFLDLQENWGKLVELGLVYKDKCSTTEFGFNHLDTILERFADKKGKLSISQR